MGLFITLLLVYCSTPAICSDRLWWSNNHIISINDHPIRVVIEDTHTGWIHSCGRLASIFKNHYGAGDWAVSPNGQWLLGIGFRPPIRGHTGSRTYLAVNLHTFRVQEWGRIGLYSRLVWSADSKSWFDVLPYCQTGTEALQFYLNSSRIRRFPISKNSNAAIIADARGKLLIADSQVDRDTICSFRWVDVLHPGKPLPSRNIKLPPGYHCVCMDYDPKTQSLYVLTYSGDLHNSADGITGPGYFVFPLSPRRRAGVRSFHTIGGGSYSKISLSPDDKRLLCCSDSAYKIITLD